MLVSHSHRFLYWPLPKTGSTSLAAALNSYNIFQWPADSGCFGYHLGARPDGLSDYFFFTTVRNPYDRALSIWKHMTCHHGVNHVSFRDFIRDWLVPRRHWMCFTQSEWLGDNRPVIFRLEERPYSLPFGEIALPWENRGVCVDVDWTGEMIDEVRMWANDDFDKFGYDPVNMPRELTPS